MSRSLRASLLSTRAAIMTLAVRAVAQMGDPIQPDPPGLIHIPDKRPARPSALAVRLPPEPTPPVLRTGTKEAARRLKQMQKKGGK